MSSTAPAYAATRCPVPHQRVSHPMSGAADPGCCCDFAMLFLVFAFAMLLSVLTYAMLLSAAIGTDLGYAAISTDLGYAATRLPRESAHPCPRRCQVPPRSNPLSRGPRTRCTTKLVACILCPPTSTAKKEDTITWVPHWMMTAAALGADEDLASTAGATQVEPGYRRPNNVLRIRFSAMSGTDI
eukprot:2528688-Rhodomonas_salina.1